MLRPITLRHWLKVSAADTGDGCGGGDDATASGYSAERFAQLPAERWQREEDLAALDYNAYVGVIGIGRIKRGKIKPGCC